MILVPGTVHAHRPESAGGQLRSIGSQDELLGKDLGAAVGVARQPPGIGERLIAVRDGPAAVDDHVDGARVHQAPYAQLPTGIDHNLVPVDVHLLEGTRGSTYVPHRGGGLKHDLGSVAGGQDIFPAPDVTHPGVAVGIRQGL